MTSPVVEKVRSYLDYSLVSKFDTNDMLTNSYIPFMVSKGSVYVFTKMSTIQSTVTATVSSILGTTNITLKTISDSDFDELLAFVSSSLHVEGVSDIDMSSDDDIQLKYDDADAIDDDGQIARPMSSDEL